MELAWFMIVAFMLVAYVILDGFDIGAGIVHYFVARDAKERAAVIRSIGPVWDGNEVWLLAAGGTLYFAFPVLYSSAFSGFYLPLIMVLWLLIMRAAGIELRHQLGLALEPLAAFHRLRECRVHHLDRDRAVDLEPLGAIDDAHRAFRDALLDLVAVLEDLAAEILHTHAGQNIREPVRGA